MRALAAFSLIMLGVLCLGISLLEPVWAPLVDPGGQSREIQDLLPMVVTGSSALALVLVGVGVVILWRGGGAAERWRPYVGAMTRLAAEHGQRIRVDRNNGLEFLAFRDGQRIHVRATDGPPPSLAVKGIIPGRQTLTFVRTEDNQPDPTGRTALVGGGRGWQLRAELPAIARSLLGDVVMISMMDRFFSHTESTSIVHDASGIEVVSALPSFDQAERRTRQAIDIVSYLRRVNG